MASEPGRLSLVDRPLLLLDSASLWFRAFYGVPASVTGPDGRPVNAVRGFVDHTARLVREHRPRAVVACLDADWRPAFRVAAIPAYKEHRLLSGDGTDTPDELSEQVGLIRQVLAAAGIPALGVAGYEADDVIATLAANASGPVLVATGDRDLFQIVGPRVQVIYTVERDRVYDESAVRDRYHLPSAASYADFAMLRGDPSDGLPGVAGIGPKTAAALVTKYGSVAAVLAAVEAGEPLSLIHI